MTWRTCTLSLLLFLSAAPSARADRPERLRLGVYDNPPQTFTEGGHAQGFIVDVMADFCQRRGYRLEIVNAPFFELFERIRRNELDVIAPIAYTPERARFLQYTSESILIDWSSLITAEKSSSKQLADLQGRTVGGVRDDRYFALLQADLRRQGISCRFIDFQDFLKVSAEVTAGRIDAGFIGRYSLGYLIKSYQDQLRVRIMPGTFYHEPLFFGINPAVSPVSRELDEYIRAGRNSRTGGLPALQEKWFGQPAVPRQLLWLSRYLPWIVLVVLLVLGLFLAFTLVLRHKVRASVQEINRQKIHFENLFKVMPAGIVILDAHNRVVDMNPEFQALFGYSLAELRGRELDTFISDEQSIDAARELSARTLRGERIISEGRRRTSAGRRIDVGIIGSPIVVDGRLQGIIAVYLDNTDKKQMEAEIIRAKNIESIGLMAGGIAHDFNNLLTAIMGHVTLARRVTSDAGVLRPLDKAELAANKATDLTRQLLTFARGGDPIKRNVNLADIIHDAVDLVISGTAIQPLIDIEPDLPVCRADATQITQVVHNVLINAREAMNQIGSIQISLQRHRHARADNFLHPGDYFALAVQDNGPGISESDLQKIFLPYFTTKKSGSGLGLAICYAIVRKHGGNIAVRSRLDQGTTFTIFLPIAAVEETVPAAAPATVTPPSSASR